MDVSVVDKSKRTFFWGLFSVEFDTPSEGLGSGSGDAVDRGAENASEMLQG